MEVQAVQVQVVEVEVEVEAAKQPKTDSHARPTTLECTARQGDIL